MRPLSQVTLSWAEVIDKLTGMVPIPSHSRSCLEKSTYYLWSSEISPMSWDNNLIGCFDDSTRKYIWSISQNIKLDTWLVWCPSMSRKILAHLSTSQSLLCLKMPDLILSSEVLYLHNVKKNHYVIQYSKLPFHSYIHNNLIRKCHLCFLLVHSEWWNLVIILHCVGCYRTLFLHAHIQFMSYSISLS